MSGVTKYVWRIRFVRGYYRLTLNHFIVASFTTKGAAQAGLTFEKRRLEERLAKVQA